MTAPIVHIGYHKTATTWLQTHLWPALTSHRHIRKAALEDAILNDHAFGYDARRAREKLFGGDEVPADVLLSHEAFSGTPHTGGLQGFYTTGMARRLRETVPDAQIVVLLRNQVDMLATTYKQYVNIGGTHGLERYSHPGRHRGGGFRKPRKMPTFTLDHFDYDRLVSLYEELFGAANVHVFLYESFRADPRAFVTDMAERLGLAVDVDALPMVGENVAFRRNTLALARVLNRFTAHNIPDKRCVWDVLPSHGAVRRLLKPLNRTRLAGPPVRTGELVPDSLRAEIAERHAAGNARLAARRALPLAAHGYPVASEPG